MALDLATRKSILGGSGKTFKEVQSGSGKVLWKAGAFVTYVIDEGVTKTEEVDMGASCLAPTTFTPAKDGWTFVGWRKDTVASADVETSVVMDGTPITLYAVFAKTVTQTFISYKHTQKVDGTAYYNKGNIEGAKITYPSGNTYEGWTWRGWSQHNATEANAVVEFDEGFVLGVGTTSYTVYGLYQQDVKLSYHINGVARSITEKMYYNASGDTKDAPFTVANPTLSGATFNGWSVTAGNAKVTYNSLASGIQLSENTTVYAVFKYDDPAMQEQTHQYDREGNTYGESYDDAPYNVTLTMPSTAGSMTVTAYGYSGPSECIYVNGIELKEDGAWRTIGTYTENTSVKIIYGYAIGCRVVFRKTYVGKTIVG